ncbi:MAG: fibronectin type III domain-containing protein, partial [Acidobacteriaceae bacterium]|nr:fibronectin type III domain-containing protein [Acidobacteriaceae bacterium]
MNYGLIAIGLRVTSVLVAVLSPVGANAQPFVTTVVNAASYSAGPIAPGQMVAIFGIRLGPSALASLQLDEHGRVAQTLAGTQVTFDGIPAPLLYVSQMQVGAIVPYGLSGRGSTQVRVTTPDGSSSPFTRSVARSSPGVFTVDSSGKGQGAVLNSTGRANSSSDPALPGSYVSIFLTGEGITEPAGADGAIAWEAARTRETVQVSIGGRPAQVLYAGAAPGNVRGFAQLNVVVPSDLEFGGSLPLEVQIGESYSQPGVTMAVAGSAVSRPGIPQSVTATPGSNEIRVSWVAADTRASQFRIERRIAPLGGFSQIGIVGSTARAFVDSSVISGVQYEYRVAAENAEGVSAFSVPVGVLYAIRPSAPSDVRAIAAGPTQINLMWSAAGASVTGFAIERRAETGEAFSPLAATIPATVRSFQDATVAPATKYRYRLRAFDASGPSPYSEEASATTPAAIIPAPILQANALTSSQIRLNWSTVATGVVRFIIERRGTGGQYAEISRPPATVSTWEDQGLTASTAYTYRMRVETASGVSPYSSEAAATTLAAPPLAPTNLRTTALSSTDVSLTWTNNATDASSIRLSMAEAGAAAYTDLGPTATLTTARVTNLRPSTTYFFLVRAQNAAG